jgi:hypothetical protein
MNTKTLDLLTVQIILKALVCSLALFSLPAFVLGVAPMLHAQAIADATVPSLPDAPSPSGQQQPSTSVAAPPAAIHAYGPLDAIMTEQSPPLSLSQKWTIYTHQAFGPPAVVFPAFSAAISMAHPKDGYPAEWKDGGGAFGRLYGNAVAQQTSKQTATFLTDALAHEDPRYLPADPGANVGVRLVHAIAFTFVDRNDSGGHTFAFGNFAGAAAGGFVGMAYLPDGYNDASHALSRSGTEFLGTVASNVVREFAPEWAPFVQKLHIFKIIPGWWVPRTHP